MRSSDAVVITGASSGIGRATALHLARRGARLVLAARGADTLEALAEECVRRGASSAVAVPTDVSDADAVERLGARAAVENGRIDVWINVAGVASYASFLDHPLEHVRRVLEVNVMGVVHGSQVALRRFRGQGYGTLITVSSLLGEVAQPYNAAYSMSKAAVRSLGGSLRSELALAGERGIHVVTVLPATIDTPFFRRHAANLTGRPVLAMPPVYPPEKVAAAIVAAIRAPRAEVVVGTLGKLLTGQHRITPRAVERLLAAQTRRFQLGPQFRRGSASRHGSGGAAARTDGTLFATLDDPAAASVTDGWRGGSRTALRTAASAASVVVPAVLLLRQSIRRMRQG